MKKCPLIQKKCWEQDCTFWIHLIGKNPQTGIEKDEFCCSLASLPILLIEGANQTRQATASIDRNNNVFFSALPEHIQQRIVKSNPNLFKLEQKIN